jgi:hypothetical protein
VLAAEFQQHEIPNMVGDSGGMWIEACFEVVCRNLFGRADGNRSRCPESSDRIHLHCSLQTGSVWGSEDPILLKVYLISWFV